MNGDALDRQPGRPRQFDVDNVMDRAVDLFWKKGYRATTTRDMEDALGLGQSSIYNTIGSKQELLESAIDRYEELATRALLEPLRQSTNGLKAIDRFIVSLKRWITSDDRHGCMLTNAMAEDGGSTTSIKRRTHKYRERLRNELHRVLLRASDNGEISANVDVEASAMLLVGLVLGLNVAARGDAPDNELSSLVAAIRAEVRSWRKS